MRLGVLCPRMPKKSDTARLSVAIDDAYQAYDPLIPETANALYEALRNQARNVVRFRLRSDDNDLVHEITVRAMIALERFKGESRLSTWFFKIAQNEVNRWLRRTIDTRETDIPLIANWTLAPDEAIGEIPEVQAVAKRLDLVKQSGSSASIDLKKLTTVLPPAQFRVIELQRMGYSLEKIAKMTQIPLGTVRSRYRLAKKKMKESLRN